MEFDGDDTYGRVRGLFGMHNIADVLNAGDIRPRNQNTGLLAVRY